MLKRPHGGSPSLLALGAALGLLSAPAGAEPAPGRYDATLCVEVASQPRHCGPATAELRAGGQWRVGVADFTYQLVRDGGQPAVLLSHGAMQVDAFPTRPVWSGDALRFDDDEKRVRYEVTLGARARR